MSFETALDLANSLGWSVHMLWQDSSGWGCILRAPAANPVWHRYNITLPCHGPDAESALIAAINSIPDASEIDIKQEYSHTPDPHAPALADLLGLNKPAPGVARITRRI